MGWLDRPRDDPGGVAGRVGIWLGCSLLFLLLFVPTAYRPVKAALMAALLLLIGTAALMRGTLRLHPAIAAWTLGLATMSAGYMLRGAMRGAPGALNVGTVYVLWPVVYTIFVAGVARLRVVRALVRALVVASIAVPLYIVSYALWAIGWLPAWLYLPLDQGQAIGVYAGYVELNVYSLSSLLFLVPFVTTCLLVWPPGETLPVRRGWLWLGVLAGSGVVFISGRRALLLCVALGPLLALVLRFTLPTVQRRASRRAVLGAMLGAVVCGVGIVLYMQSLGLTVDGLVRMFLEGFDFQGNRSASLRRLQLFALMDGWSAHPLLGAGHGARAPALVRTIEMPWAYELSYVALLFHVGILGFIAYAAAVGWITASSIRLVRAGTELSFYLVPALVGMFCFLIANATNPYLEKFDYLWVVFLPLCLVNYGLLCRNSPVRSTVA